MLVLPINEWRSLLTDEYFEMTCLPSATTSRFEEFAEVSPRKALYSNFARW